MSDKIYCGNGKERTFDGGGSVVTVTLDLDVLMREYGTHGFLTDQGKRKIRLKVAKSRQADQYNNTHYTEIDVWHPDNYVPPEPVNVSSGVREHGQSHQENGRQGFYHAVEQSPPPEKPKFESYTPSPSPESFGGGSNKFEDDIPFNCHRD